MNRLFILLIYFLVCSGIYAQSQVDVVTGENYQNENYYSFTYEELNLSPRNDWDLAFATGNNSVALHANNGAGVMVYTYPNGDISTWENIDTTGLSAWPAMFNSIDDIELGALNANTIEGNNLDYGWGTYNIISHQITGDSLFILKTVNEEFKKLWIVKRNPLPGTNSWEIKYANIDGSNEENITIDANSHNSKNFVHFSIENNIIIEKEPPSDEWDLLFTRYYDYTIPYYVSGVLANTYRVSIQQVDSVDQVNYENYTESLFDKTYSEIGSDWKDFNTDIFAYEINSERVYFLKVMNSDASDSTYWKLYFTGYSGSSSGTYSFVQKDVTNINSVNEIEGLELFEVYPNPSKEYIQVISDANRSLNYQISDLNGKEIINGSLKIGFNKKTIDISNLKSGIYLISLISNDGISSQKFIKQ